MSKHTAGPWFIMDGRTTAALDDLVGERPFKIYADSFGTKVHHVATGASEEDARLIAAAPDMYEALKRVDAWLDEPATPWPTQKDADKAWLLGKEVRTALQKVEGG